MTFNPVKTMVMGIMFLVVSLVLAFVATGLMGFVGWTFVEWFRTVMFTEGVLTSAFALNRVDTMLDLQTDAIKKKLEEQNGKR